MEIGNPDKCQIFWVVVFAFNLNQFSPAPTSLGSLGSSISPILAGQGEARLWWKSIKL